MFSAMSNFGAFFNAFKGLSPMRFHQLAAFCKTKASPNPTQKNGMGATLSAPTRAKGKRIATPFCTGFPLQSLSRLSAKISLLVEFIDFGFL
jgi:hypothetical protein